MDQGQARGKRKKEGNQHFWEPRPGEDTQPVSHLLPGRQNQQAMGRRPSENRSRPHGLRAEGLLDSSHPWAAVQLTGVPTLLPPDTDTSPLSKCRSLGFTAGDTEARRS